MDGCIAPPGYIAPPNRAPRPVIISQNEPRQQQENKFYRKARFIVFFFSLFEKLFFLLFQRNRESIIIAACSPLLAAWTRGSNLHLIGAAAL